VAGTLTVSPATLIATVQSASTTYGTSTTPSVTYGGFVPGDTAANSFTTQPTVTVSAKATSGAGNYSTTASGGVASNYTILYQPRRTRFRQPRRP